MSDPVAWLDADWLADPPTRAVFAALTDAGFAAYAVGGCVRNALLGRPVSDIDIATDARPDTTTAAAVAAGLKAVPTGAAHGTITVVADRRGFEVTTFRHDVDTDGRHAVVRFSDRLEDDAARRDFTMNALYARPDGAVLDPVGGLADLRAGRLRFIGDPDAITCASCGSSDSMPGTAIRRAGSMPTGLPPAPPGPMDCRASLPNGWAMRSCACWRHLIPRLPWRRWHRRGFWRGLCRGRMRGRCRYWWRWRAITGRMPRRTRSGASWHLAGRMRRRACG